jgi:hypothetical protein
MTTATLSKDRYTEIAQTILAQLGGKRFSIMTGAKHFMSHPEGALSFQLPRGAQEGINYVKIQLDRGADAYSMTFTRIGPMPGLKALIAGKTQKVTEVKTYEMVHCDQLQSLFTTNTGLHTHL